MTTPSLPQARSLKLFLRLPSRPGYHFVEIIEPPQVLRWQSLLPTRQGGCEVRWVADCNAGAQWLLSQLTRRTSMASESSGSAMRRTVRALLQPTVQALDVWKTGHGRVSGRKVGSQMAMSQSTDSTFARGAKCASFVEPLVLKLG